MTICKWVLSSDISKPNVYWKLILSEKMMYKINKNSFKEMAEFQTHLFYVSK